jgi:hypothetical protein
MFTAWHPETEGANRSEPERANDPDGPLVREAVCVAPIADRIMKIRLPALGYAKGPRADRNGADVGEGSRSQSGDHFVESGRPGTRKSSRTATVEAGRPAPPTACPPRP